MSPWKHRIVRIEFRDEMLWRMTCPPGCRGNDEESVGIWYAATFADILDGLRAHLSIRPPCVPALAVDMSGWLNRRPPRRRDAR